MILCRAFKAVRLQVLKLGVSSRLPPNLQVGQGLHCQWIYASFPVDKGVRKEATDKAFSAFSSHFILGFFGLSTEKALHSSIDRDQRLVRSCSAPELHLLVFLIIHYIKAEIKNLCLAPTGNSAYNRLLEQK